MLQRMHIQVSNRNQLDWQQSVSAFWTRFSIEKQVFLTMSSRGKSLGVTSQNGQNMCISHILKPVSCAVGMIGKYVTFFASDLLHPQIER